MKITKEITLEEQQRIADWLDKQIYFFKETQATENQMAEYGIKLCNPFFCYITIDEGLETLAKVTQSELKQSQFDNRKYFDYKGVRVTESLRSENND